MRYRAPSSVGCFGYDYSSGVISTSPRLSIESIQDLRVRGRQSHSMPSIMRNSSSMTTPQSNQPQHKLLSPSKSYFEVDGDEILQHSDSMATERALTWRGDPQDTLSDWTIVIVTNELQTASYHVHKSVLCFGPRASKFFAKIMLQNHQVQSSSKRLKKSRQEAAPTTKVELNQCDAENFPHLLDFIYAPCSNVVVPHDATLLTANSTMTGSHGFGSLMTSHTIDEEGSNESHPVEEEFITTKNAVSLRYLAKTFEVESFMIAVNRFIQRDLNFKTGPSYLTKAWEYSDDRLMASAQQLCAENFEQLDVKALTKLPSNLIRVVVKTLESFDEDNKDLSLFISEVVCRYLEKNPKALSASFLLEMTDPLIMPYISSEAAIGFTALTKDLNPKDAVQHWDGLMSLCRRCARTVVQEYGWCDFSVNDASDEYLRNGLGLDEPDEVHPNDTRSKEISHIDSLLFATSFAAALEQAQNDYESIATEQNRLKELIDEMNESLTIMESFNRAKDEQIRRQQEVLQESRSEIIELKRQIEEMKEQQQQCFSFPASGSCLSTAMSPDEIVRDLISPSMVEGKLMASRRGRRARELLTKEEMRSMSLL